MIEKQEATDKELAKLEGALEEILDENEDLKNKLAEELKKVQEASDKAGVSITKTNTVNVTNSSDTTIIQDLDTKGGNITIN